MKEAYENQGTATFLVCELQPGDQLEGISLRALAGGKLRGFAAAAFSQVANTKYIRYNVSGKTPFFRLLNGIVSKKVLLGALNGIADALISMEANQVDISTAILDPGHVFTDPATGETVLICLPLMSARSVRGSMGMLCGFILSKVQLDPREDSSFLPQLQSFVSSDPELTPAALKAELDKVGALLSAAPAQPAPVQPAAPQQPEPVRPIQPAVPVAPSPVQQPQPRTDKPMSMFRLLEHYKNENSAAPKQQEIKQPAAPVQPEKNAARQFDFPIPGAPVQPAKPAPVQPVVPAPVQPVKSPVSAPVNPDDTTVVDAGQISGAHAYLVRIKTGERAPITKPFFRIGKEKSYVDYFVGDNSAISRAHAYIIKKDGQYFLVDTHSTNHTYINGGMIPPEVETRLFHGAKVRLANEEFEFKLH